MCFMRACARDFGTSLNKMRVFARADSLFLFAWRLSLSLERCVAVNLPSTFHSGLEAVRYVVMKTGCRHVFKVQGS